MGLVPENYFGEDAAARYDEGSGAEFDPDVIRRTVDVLAELAGGGAALEFALGTGRIALPLAARGVPVSGIELSPAIAERLRVKDDAQRVKVTIGDMATTRVEGTFRHLRRLPPGEDARVFAHAPGYVGYDRYIDLVAQQAMSHHFAAGRSGVREFQTPFRYVWPSELDLMARLAGMSLRDRWADWDRSVFTGESGSHVSVWQKASST